MTGDPFSAPPGGSTAGGSSGSGFDFKAMFDAMEFARRSWSSSFSMPGSFSPTVDPEELDKRIADLRTVEQWLVLNLNLLRGAIQALELQRAALGSLKSFGEAARASAEATAQASAQSSAQSSTRASAQAAEPPAAAPPGLDPAVWWQTLQNQFKQITESALASTSAAMAAATQAGKPSAATATAEGARPRKSSSRKRADAAANGKAVSTSGKATAASRPRAPSRAKRPASDR